MKRCQGCDAAVEGTDPHTACVMCLGETHALAALTKVTCTACAALGAQELLRRASMHREDASWADFPEPFAMHSQEDRPNLRDGRVPSDTAHLEEALLTLANSSGDEDDDLLLHSSDLEMLPDYSLEPSGSVAIPTATDDVSAELRKNAGAILHLTQGLAQDFGRIMGWSVASLRHLWLANSALPEADKVPLLDAPVSLDARRSIEEQPGGRRDATTIASGKAWTKPFNPAAPRAHPPQSKAQKRSIGVLAGSESKLARTLRRPITDKHQVAGSNSTPPPLKSRASADSEARGTVCTAFNQKDGGVRPILDLRALNRHLVKRRFQMLTHKRVMSSISQGDWFTLVDLKDAYFHVNIVQRHWQYLRFAFLGRAYEFTKLPFGLSLAPRTFEMERIASLRGHACRFLPGRCISGITIMRLLGLMAAAIAVVPLGLLRMRPVQLWLKRMHFDPMRDRAKLFRIPQSVVRALSHWRDGRMLSVGVPMGAISTHVPVYTDASTKGWGAVCNGMMASGLWNPPLPHINVLEITAVWLALQRFEPLLRGRHVLIRSDNKATVAYVNRQGGTKCPHLHRLAVRIWTWAYPRVRSLRALYVPGQLNCGADLLSRGGPSPLEWCLHPLVVAEVWSRFGKAIVDLFASRQNAHCPLWFAMTATGSPPLGVDALAHCWPKGLLYAFPPFGLVPQVLAKAREERKPLILIAPDWPHKQWMADVALLLTDVPWRLPQRRDLL
ncbi:uncharacterized protein LOC133128861, partial [Conger conger]|uniref:uncharacterized protein LOC133128861 n=1 Tax=Conger conger TaxID=82655 RepID=UPI002A59B195